MPERPAEAQREQVPAEDKTVYASGPQAGTAPSAANNYPNADADKPSDEQLPYRPN
ncbi:hypothetical protein [Dictyobacter halimunensis]|uniref:hypothetical protein n=1 Tax=Dictyobacter halimunensis TaxID=3026934 RepID=UPI0030C7853E